jgi:hypothetical protein
MPEPTKIPLRVLVKGASTVIYTSWMSGPRSDFAWPRAIEAELHAASWPADVRCTAVPAERTKHAIEHWHDEVLAWSPDVVVFHYGHMECVHLFLPRFLERHVNDLRARPFPIREAYRKYLLRPFWMFLAKLQMRADEALPQTLLSFRPRRAAADLVRMIELTRTVASPLVLVPEIPPAGRPYEKWFPGMTPRIAVMNETFRETIRKLDDPDVRFVPLRDVWTPIVGEDGDPCPDGGHFTPEVHRAVGQKLADIVLEWAEKQPHLLVEPRPRD